jgi:two-component sensor histidine kinase
VKRSEGAGTVVTVTNDGDGVDEDFDAANAPSLGMRIATTLARQLDGSYSLRPAPERGTIAELRISA